MTNQFPPPDWYLRPDEWPYWTPNTLPSSGLMPNSTARLSLEPKGPCVVALRDAIQLEQRDSGDFGQAGEWNDPQTTIPRQGAWDPSVPPIPFAPPAAFSLPVLPAMRTPGVNTEGYSPLYDAATREDMRPATAASFGRTAAAPQPSGWDALISPIEHLEIRQILGSRTDAVARGFGADAKPRLLSFAGAACPKLGGDPAACESRSDGASSSTKSLVLECALRQSERHTRDGRR